MCLLHLCAHEVEGELSDNGERCAFTLAQLLAQFTGTPRRVFDLRSTESASRNVSWRQPEPAGQLLTNIPLRSGDAGQ